MKQINNSPDKSVLLRETFNSEASVRLNGGVCANVDFESGKAFFQNTGSITYSNPVLSIGAFTIRARVKLTIVNQYNVIASFDNVSTIELRTDLGGELVMYVDSVKKSSGKVLAVNTWYDIVVTRDDSGVIIFYVNGESFSGGTQAGTFYNKNLTIGKRGAGTTLYYNGYMDLFEYYDRSMTAAEITYILNDRAFRITDQVKRDRVAISGGTQGKIIDYKSLITFYRKRGMWDKTHLCLVPFLGYKASSGLIDTVYDLKGSILKNNDATQGTTANKPRVAGNIAPSEVLSMSNPNGDARYLTHPSISFAANQAWSIVWCINWEGTQLNKFPTISGRHIAETGKIDLDQVGDLTYKISFTNLVNITAVFNPGSSKPFLNKNTIGVFVADGNNTLKLYINGNFIESLNVNTVSIWSSIIRGYGYAAGREFGGKFHFYRIQSGAMTATQVLAEYNKLRTYIPEIETVLIGSKYITSSNFQAVATPAGNVIPEVQLASIWSTAETIYNNTYSSTVGTSEQKNYAALKAAAMWCSYDNSTANQAIYGKFYNHYAKELLKADMLAQSFGYHITTESEWTVLAALGGYKLRKEGTTYWSEATGTNTTGFTALGGGKRLTSGVFQGLLTNVAYWVGDTQKVVIISGDTVTIQAANTQEGNYIRLTKD